MAGKRANRKNRNSDQSMPDITEDSTQGSSDNGKDTARDSKSTRNGKSQDRDSQNDKAAADNDDSEGEEDPTHHHRSMLKGLDAKDAATYRVDELKRLENLGPTPNEDEFTNIPMVHELIHTGNPENDQKTRRALWRDMSLAIGSDHFRSLGTELFERSTTVQKLLGVFLDGNMARTSDAMVLDDPKPQDITAEHRKEWERMKNAMYQLQKDPQSQNNIQQLKKFRLAVEKLNKKKGVPVETGWPSNFGGRYLQIQRQLELYKLYKADQGDSEVNKLAIQATETQLKGVVEAIDKDCEEWGFPQSWRYPSTDLDRPYGPNPLLNDEKDSNKEEDKKDGDSQHIDVEEEAEPPGTRAKGLILDVKKTNGKLLVRTDRRKLDTNGALPDNAKVVALFKSGRGWKAITRNKDDYCSTISQSECESIILANLDSSIPRLGKEVYERYLEELKDTNNTVDQGGFVYDVDSGTTGHTYFAYFVKFPDGHVEEKWLSMSAAAKHQPKSYLEAQKGQLDLPDFKTSTRQKKLEWKGPTTLALPNAERKDVKALDMASVMGDLAAAVESLRLKVDSIEQGQKQLLLSSGEGQT